MDRIDRAVTTSVATPPTSTPDTEASGLGTTFRAVARGTTIEPRRRSLRGTPRTGRALAPDAGGATDSGTWRLAL